MTGVINNLSVLQKRSAGGRGRRQLDGASTLGESVDVGWTLIAGCFVFMMQAGFTLLEAGSARVKNGQSVAMKNVIDAACGAAMWFIMGWGLAFGEDNADAENGGGIMGTSMFFVKGDDLYNAADGTMMFDDFFFQWTFCATTATIVSGALAERCALEAYILVATAIAGILQPIIVHWTWGGGWLAEKGFLDFAGSGIVHMHGGVLALCGSAVLGPRIGRFDEKKTDSDEPEENEFAPSSVLDICLGVFLLWFGWFGFNAGSTVALADGNHITAARCCVTTTMAASMGGIMSFILGSLRHKKYDIVGFANGILAGLVGVTASTNNVDIPVAAIIGLISGILYDLSSQMLIKFKVDDVVGAFPVHGACGAWGCIAAGLFDLDLGVFNGGAFGDALGPNIIGILAIAAFGAGTSLPIFITLKKTGHLRVSEEMELEGLDIEFVNPTTSRRGAPSETASARSASNVQVDVSNK